jgi:hypothetical protein
MLLAVKYSVLNRFGIQFVQKVTGSNFLPNVTGSKFVEGHVCATALNCTPSFLCGNGSDICSILLLIVEHDDQVMIFCHDYRILSFSAIGVFC